MKHYDLILVLGYFRSATPFLSVVKHLSPHLRVGVVPAGVDPSFLANNERAQILFLELCRQFGAEIITQGTHVKAGLMVVQQFIYPPTTAETIMATIKTGRRVGLMGLAMAGLANHDAFLKQFKIELIYVPDKMFFEFLLEHRQAWEQYEGVDVVETGLPYAISPIFLDFQADYLIAAPTMFSFHTERGKHSFLRCVLKLLSQIPKTEKIVYKPHNGAGQDYFTPKWHYSLARMLLRIPGCHHALTRLMDIAPSPLGSQLERIQTGILHLQVLDRAIHMGDATPYAEMSLEAFLPGVRKGVIGGLSNTIWGTLYFGLPYYNCVDPAMRDGSSQLIQRKSDNLLDLNLQYFGVPYCEGELSLGAPAKGDLADAADGRGLLAVIQDDIERLKCAI